MPFVVAFEGYAIQTLSAFSSDLVCQLLDLCLGRAFRAVFFNGAKKRSPDD